VAITEQRSDRILGFLWRPPPNVCFHSATDWATRDAPELGHAMHTTETLAIRSPRCSRARPSGSRCSGSCPSPAIC
jgi:hypothetical protein